MLTPGTQPVELFIEAGGFVDGHFVIRGQHTDKAGLPDACFLVPGLFEWICRWIADSVSAHQPSGVVVPAFGGIPYATAVSSMLDVPLYVAERSSQGQFNLVGETVPEGRVVAVDSSCHSLETLANVERAARRAGAEVTAAAVVVCTTAERFEAQTSRKWSAPLYSFSSAVVGSWDPEECPMCARGVPVAPKPVIRTRLHS